MSTGQIVSEESPIARQLVAAKVVTQSKQPEKMWKLTLDGPGAIVVSAWSSTGTCVAVATDTTVYVIDSAGRPLWDWKFQETSRYLHPTGYYRYAFALSPACDAVVMGGGSDYKYIWLADRNGGRSFFKTTGTPFHAKFDLRGETIAVTTGAWVGYLLSPRLNERWAGRVGNLPMKWRGELIDAARISWADFLREDVQDLFELPWGDGELDSVSDDGGWRIVFSTPYRFTGPATIELWGPSAEGFRARFTRVPEEQRRWIKRIGCPSPEITRDGMFVVTTGDPVHPEYMFECSGEESVYVFDRDGNTVLTWPHNGSRDEMSEAVFARTGVRLSLSERPTWAGRIPRSAEQVTDGAEILEWTRYSPDGQMVLISRGRDVRVYTK